MMRSRSSVSVMRCPQAEVHNTPTIRQRGPAIEAASPASIWLRPIGSLTLEFQASGGQRLCGCRNWSKRAGTVGLKRRVDGGVQQPSRRGNDHEHDEDAEKRAPQGPADRQGPGRQRRCAVRTGRHRCHSFPQNCAALCQGPAKCSSARRKLPDRVEDSLKEAAARVKFRLKKGCLSSADVVGRTRLTSAIVPNSP